ncbi:imidazolonepropionase-like domain-containing protein [Streptomyces sp. NPDC051636]|uniref:imidazolonepropionase-like domain-containing protein n=1 Tax=Streptomyces sp. NPDC051636 TaxID=3365663 RepID=UPI003799B1E2
MLTIHADSRGRALVVQGEWIAAVGSLEELAAAHPRARVRTWPGILTPGFVNVYGNELLEQTYHPDPREADDLGTEPLTGEALTMLVLDDTRWGASARRGIQRMLAQGTVTVACEPFRNRAVKDAVRRSGIGTTGRLGRPGDVPSLDPFGSARPPMTAIERQQGSAARFAVFDVRDEAELAERGAGTCVATVVAGRLVFRRR